MSVDIRATTAIKISLNKILKNKNSENLCIAKTISEFSHKTPLEWGSRFESKTCHFYIVNRLYSPFWAQVTFIPPVSSFFYDVTQPWGLWYRPNWPKASSFHKKKIFKPFSSRPYIKKRNTKFFFQDHRYLKKKYYIPDVNE